MKSQATLYFSLMVTLIHAEKLSDGHSNKYQKLYSIYFCNRHSAFEFELHHERQNVYSRI